VSASTSSSELGERRPRAGLHIDTRFALLTAILVAVSFGLSSIPDVDSWNGPVVTTFFNVMHAPLFGAVAWCCYQTLASGRELSIPALVLAFVASLAYAVLDEWHQSFVIGRNASTSDVIVDLIGASLTLLLMARWSALRAVRLRTSRRARPPDASEETSS
jgi:VanZ like protein